MFVKFRPFHYRWCVAITKHLSYQKKNDNNVRLYVNALLCDIISNWSLKFTSQSIIYLFYKRQFHKHFPKPLCLINTRGTLFHELSICDCWLFHWADFSLKKKDEWKRDYTYTIAWGKHSRNSMDTCRIDLRFRLVLFLKWPKESICIILFTFVVIRNHRNY